MPLLIFIMLYITGVMLSFAGKSNLPGVRVNLLLRTLMFMKVKKRLIFAHALIFQSLNILLFSLFIAFYFLNEKNINAVYNIYKWASLALFIVIMTVTAADAAILEKNGKVNENH